MNPKFFVCCGESIRGRLAIPADLAPPIAGVKLAHSLSSSSIHFSSASAHSSEHTPVPTSCGEAAHITHGTIRPS